MRNLVAMRREPTLGGLLSQLNPCAKCPKSSLALYAAGGAQVHLCQCGGRPGDSSNPDITDKDACVGKLGDATMKCLYINLDSASARRAAVERSFAAHVAPGWDLLRVQAVDVDSVRRRSIGGAISDTAKACYLSHKHAIDCIANISKTSMIIEDDTVFGRRSMGAIAASVALANKSFEWDLLYTDAIIPNIREMSELSRLRPALMDGGNVTLIDLKDMQFGSTSAYVVNAKSAQRLKSLFSVERIDTPIDLFLRKLIHEGHLKAFLTFPFLTTVSEHADDSFIQLNARTDLIWNTFRRMAWIEGDAFDPTPVIEKFPISERSKAYCALWGAMIDPSYVNK